MQFTERYSPGLYLGVVGIGTLILMNSMGIHQDLQQANQLTQYRRAADLEKARLQQQTEVDQERARLARQKAQTYADNEVLDTNSFSLWGYTDNPNRPPRLDYRAMQPDLTYIIYDGAGACIGVVIDRKFYWRHSQGNNDICQRFSNDQNG